MSATEGWKLICLRSWTSRPTRADLESAFPPDDVAGYAEFRDVHPLDAERALKVAQPRIVATLSPPIIDCFWPTSIVETRRRLWFHDGPGSLRQVSAKQAREFLLSLQVGIALPHQILLTHGLWR